VAAPHDVECSVFVDGADCERHVGGAGGLAGAVAGEGEVTPAEAVAVIGEAFGDVEKHALAGPAGLIAKLGVADLGAVDRDGELFRASVDIESLKGQKMIVHGGATSCPLAQARPSNPSTPGDPRIAPQHVPAGVDGFDGRATSPHEVAPP
jgi:hypothetical protein